MSEETAEEYRDIPGTAGYLNKKIPLGENARCLYCGSFDVWLEWRILAKPIGTFSLAGGQMKFSAAGWPYAVCGGCGHVSKGKIDGMEAPDE